MEKLENKTALITGASGDIGKAIAKRLHAQGVTTILSGTRVEVLDTLSKELGNNSHVVAADLSDRQSVITLTETIQQQFPPVDILVNNAGLTKDNITMRIKDDDWDKVIQVNLTSSFLLIRNLLRSMIKNRYGRIVNISSITGVVGNVGQCNYAASKAGLIGMSKSIAIEVASRGITVNCIAPGFIETNMTAILTEQQKSNLQQLIPMRAMGKPEDIAGAVSYLVSQDGRYITGQTIHINGGMAML